MEQFSSWHIENLARALLKRNRGSGGLETAGGAWVRPQREGPSCGPPPCGAG